MFTLPPLPYGYDALSPVVSDKTLHFHHDKHHATYVKTLNELLDKKGGKPDSLEEVIAAARGSNQGLFNNAAQSWNHGFYWHSLSPSGGTPSGDLAAKIDAAFGSLDALTSKLAERGAGHFASGWVWLADRGGQLTIEETHDGDTLADSGFNPLLTIDVWEHAYYLDYQNVRPDYLKAVLDGHLNWQFAADNLARGTAWKYPG